MVAASITFKSEALGATASHIGLYAPAFAPEAFAPPVITAQLAEDDAVEVEWIQANTLVFTGVESKSIEV